MNRKEAAQFLGVSEKTVSRYVSGGRLKASRVRGALDVSIEDLEALKEAIETPQPVPQKSETGQDSSVLVPLKSSPKSDPSNLVFDALARLLARELAQGDTPRQEGQSQPSHGVPISEKLLLTLDEAAELSGLSAARLRAAIGEGTLQGAKIGRGWKIKKSDLKIFVKDLF